jgi:hypothetical protein
MEKIWNLNIQYVYLKNDIMCIMVEGKWNLLIYKNKNMKIYELIIKDISARYELNGEVNMDTINKDMIDDGNNNIYSRIMFKTIGNWNNKCWRYMENSKEKDDKKIINSINSMIS